MICSHSGVDVSLENKLFPFGDTPNGYINVLVELIFDLRYHVKGGHIHPKKSDGPITDVEPESW